MRDYRTTIETQPMTNICYDYVDTKLIINVYRFICIDLSCQIINQFSNRIELINRLSEQSAEDGTHLHKICTLFFLVRSSQYINTTMSQFSYKDIGACLSYESQVYRAKIETQPMTNICYDYVDTKLIINVYRFICIDLSCQIINQFSNRIELINRLSEQSAEDGTHLHKICTLFFLVRSSQYINTTMSQFSYKDIGACLSYEDRNSTNDEYLLRLRRHKVNHKCIPIYLYRFILSNNQPVQ